GMMKAPARSWSARKARPLSAWVDMVCAFDDLDEIAFFPEDQPLGLGHREIRAGVRIRLQARAVALVRRKAVETDEPPRHVVRAFVREKVPDQMAAAPRNDAAPVLGVLREVVSLKRIDLVANHAGDRHVSPPGSWLAGGAAAGGRERCYRRGEGAQRIAAADRR